MSSPIKFIALLAVTCLIAIISTGMAVAQIAPSEKSPVAFVYVSSSPGNNTTEINGFAAASNGELTPVSGSPFSTNGVTSIALTSQYLFGSNSVDIYSYSIASDGALAEVSSINAQQESGSGCGDPTDLFLDHTGATLYDMDYIADCANNAYQYFTVEGSGDLSYLGMTNVATPAFETGMSFIGNNLYAYGASCYHFSPSIHGFQRNSDGTLTSLSDNPAMPKAQAGDGYCPYLAGADPTNHVAISMQEMQGYGGTVGPPQLAVYTADDAGNLTTTSTYGNMPKTGVKAVTYLSMSPSGKLLAVSGTKGLQAFHFNGANPITHFTSLLTKDEVDQMFWDNNNHLYAISRSAGKLFVFTITPTSAKEAPGSPYAITSPQNIIVLPK